MAKSMKVQGHNGQIELTDTVLRISRKGAIAFMTQGLKGDKEILIGQVSSIQFKSAGTFTNGYIQFAFLGGREAKGGLFQGASDENTVIFTAKQQKDFEKLRDEMMSRIASRGQGGAAVSASSEIEKLAELRDRGILTEKEFAAQKRKLLARE